MSENEFFEAAPSSSEPESELPETKPPFGCGYKPDAFSEKDWNASARFGAVTKLPAECLGLRDFIRRIHNQTITSSCVGQALSQAIDIRLRKLGFEGAEPSSLALYAGAREMDHATMLLDVGCRPRDAMRFAQTNGVPREDVWPFDPANVNEKTPWDVLQDASRFLLFAWWRIYASGQQRSDAIAQALAQGFPVIFGLSIDNAFFAYSGGTIVAMNRDIAGGHMLCIVGYRTRADGTREFLGVNSWGLEWGESGMFWIHEDVLESDRTSDFYVVEVSP